MEITAPVAREMRTLLEAQDQYFAGEPNLVAVFDFDYETIIEFQQKVAWAQFVFLPPAWCSCFCCVPCFLNQNVEWRTRAKHVALTADGIKYVAEKHKNLCGLPCSDVGRDSKTVPYDMITDCDVAEPAGTACCCCIENVLSTVRVDTASSGRGDGGPELALVGLRRPHDFKQAVWAMKRSQGGRGIDVGQATHIQALLTGARASPLPSAPPAAAQAGLLAVPPQSQMLVGLLTEIRDELREVKDLLREQRLPAAEAEASSSKPREPTP